MEFAAGVTNSAPIVNRRSFGVSQRCRHDFEIRKLTNCSLDHALKVAHVEFRVMFVESFNFESECGSEVLFVADHYVGEWLQFAINSDSFRLTNNRLPERIPIIEIV